MFILIFCFQTDQFIHYFFLFVTNNKIPFKIIVVSRRDSSLNKFTSSYYFQPVNNTHIKSISITWYWSQRLFPLFPCKLIICKAIDFAYIPMRILIWRYRFLQYLTFEKQRLSCWCRVWAISLSMTPFNTQLLSNGTNCNYCGQ